MIRKATLSDLDRILEIETECFVDDAQSKRSLKYLILSKHANFIVYVKNRKVIAMMILFTRVNSQRLRIYSLAVDPMYQGFGVGKKLLHYSKKYALDFGYDLITLEVKESNVAAIGLYGAFGFKISGMKFSYYHNNENGISMYYKVDQNKNENFDE
ncbi:GNAT family N-acetyltransferase [Thiotrichales bacterium 19S3-7]|nr:GNAT family N-acetyltransferase [Thiotrichales bacterium 19S3-7]MCF6801307.1 GNAT family N-acetyltransferase [Thiotrichales bacterium 19S3-11]